MFNIKLDHRTNHVIIYVDDGTYNYYIEATAEPSWDYYSNGVNGWFYDLV